MLIFFFFFFFFFFCPITIDYYASFFNCIVGRASDSMMTTTKLFISAGLDRRFLYVSFAHRGSTDVSFCCSRLLEMLFGFPWISSCRTAYRIPDTNKKHNVAINHVIRINIISFIPFQRYAIWPYKCIQRRGQNCASNIDH